MSTESDYLQLERDGSIVTLTLSRPEKRNAYSDADTVAIGQLLGRLRADPDVRALVITGAGTTFSSGHLREELSETGDHEGMRLDEYENGRRFFRSVLDFPKPIVVALNGVAIGVPLVLALIGGDIVVAERRARFMSPHVTTGLVPAANASVWPLYVGLLRAKRLLLLPEWISAEEAQQLGLVTEVVDDGASLERATEYATRLSALPPRALRYTKQVLNSWMHDAVNGIYEHARALEFLSMGTEEYRQAVNQLRQDQETSSP